MEDDILFDRSGAAGLITLNRPETLNAVTDGMLAAIDTHLDEWCADDRITRIVIRAVPGRAFSAGGDIRHLYETGKRGQFDFDFFRREYTLNARIHSLTKPYIALVDGIAMGGGVGVSFHGSYRVGGDAMAFAMPEVGIGFFPDVGGSYILSRLPGHLGLYLGLTGARVKQADALWSGLITHSVSSDRMGELVDALSEDDSVDATLEEYSKPLSAHGPLQQRLDWIDAAFSQKSVLEVINHLTRMSQSSSGLGAEQAAWASETLDTLAQKSPTSLEIAFQQIRSASGLSMGDCMKMELRILYRILPREEFYEGIRAAIIDKDQKPSWAPATLEKVDPQLVASHFDSLGDDELKL